MSADCIAHSVSIRSSEFIATYDSRRIPRRIKYVTPLLQRAVPHSNTQHDRTNSCMVETGAFLRCMVRTIHLARLTSIADKVLSRSRTGRKGGRASASITKHKPGTSVTGLKPVAHRIARRLHPLSRKLDSGDCMVKENIGIPKPYRRDYTPTAAALAIFYNHHNFTASIGVLKADALQVTWTIVLMA
nr:hypothetical protein CFP56_24623 [Quercus suber]